MAEQKYPLRVKFDDSIKFIVLGESELNVDEFLQKGKYFIIKWKHFCSKNSKKTKVFRIYY